MIVNYKCKDGKLTLKFTPEKSDPSMHEIFITTFKTTRQITMDSNECKFYLPSDWTMDSVHPDVFALAILAAIYPFCGSTIHLPRGVSKTFHNLVFRVTKKKILPVDDQLPLRKAPSNAVPALSYSGGVDSTAAAILLPKNTHLFYFDRITPKGKNTLLNQEAAYYACDSIAKTGRTVHKIKTDMQFLRKPVGFSSYLSDTVPALLLADYYGFDSIGHGQTLETGYQIGETGFEECFYTDVGNPWYHLLKGIGLHYTLPTIGLSEVSTTNIVLESPFHEFTQACSRGKIKQPCMNCFKCFRKSLLEKVMLNEPIDDAYLNRLFNIKEVKAVLATKPPIYFSNVLAYITARYRGSHPQMLALRSLTRGNLFPVDWLNKWYPKSEEFLAPQYRDYVKKQIQKYIQPMNTQDIQTMKTAFSKAYFQT